MIKIKTHDVEQLLGITKQTLIYYEKEGLIKPSRNKNNYREYNQNDIELLQLTLTLRSMAISVDDIKLILSGELSIRYCLKNKQEYFQQEKKKIEIIENEIADYFKRTKVTIVNPKKGIEDNDYIRLYYLDDQIKFDQNIIAVKDIKSILKHARKVGEYDAKIDAKADENEYVYVEDEEGVIKDLEKEFKDLDDRLSKLTDVDGYDIKRYREEHHSLKKAKEVLAKAGKLK